MYQFQPHGVCSRLINFDLTEDDRVTNLSFLGGCNGNLKAIGKLVEGMEADSVIAVLKGNDCGGRGTSCTDQFSQALELALQQKYGNAPAEE